MKDSIITLLNDLSARLDYDIVDENEAESALNEEFSETQHHVSSVSDEIRKLADPDDAFAFAGELATFLEGAKGKALQSRKLRGEIAKMQEQIVEAQGEYSYLSAGRSALAAKVSHAMQALEAAQVEYDENELRLGTLERRIEAARLERSALHRRLDELTRSKEASK